MLKIILLEYSYCKKCKSEYKEKNKPYLLSCGETICEKCISKLNGNVDISSNFSFICPFDNSHAHNNNTITNNRTFYEILECCKKYEKENNNKNSLSLKDILLMLKNENRKKTEDNVLNGEIIHTIPLVNGKPIGRGALYHKSIGTFEGVFNGYFHKGTGTIQYYNDKGFYKGSWEYYKKNGKGTMEYNNLDKYEGEFKNDLFDGYGKYYDHSQKMILEGNWKKGKKNGNFLIKDFNDNLIYETKYVMDEEQK